MTGQVVSKSTIGLKEVLKQGLMYFCISFM